MKIYKWNTGNSKYYYCDYEDDNYSWPPIVRLNEIENDNEIAFLKSTNRIITLGQITLPNGIDIDAHIKKMLEDMRQLWAITMMHLNEWSVKFPKMCSVFCAMHHIELNSFMDVDCLSLYGNPQSASLLRGMESLMSKRTDVELL